MNNTIITGNLTRDPEPRSFESNGKTVTVVNFTVASSRHFKRKDGTPDQETFFLDCEAWDTGAKTIAEHFSKGDPILVTGSLKNETWDDKDGNRHYKVKLRVDRFEFFQSRRAKDSNTGEPAGVGSADSPSNEAEQAPF